VLFLDFAKVFDTMHHQRLLLKLQSYGITGRTHHWISQLSTKQTQRVAINGTNFRVLSGVAQGTMMGPVTFILYINNIRVNILSTISMFADDCIVIILQKDLPIGHTNGR